MSILATRIEVSPVWRACAMLAPVFDSVPRSSFARRAFRRFTHAVLPHRGNGYHPHLLRDHHLIGHAAFFTGLKALLILGATLIPSEAFLAPDVLADQASALVQLTNRVREEQGLPALVVSSLLVRSSGLRSHDMATKSYFSHVSPDGHRLSYFLKAAGYAYREAGENLAMGFSDADGALQGWMKSPTHYANLVDPVFEQIGIGVEGGVMNGKPTVFVAQHFGAPYHEAPEVIPAPERPPEPVREHPVPASVEQVATRVAPAVAGVKTPVATRPTLVMSSAPPEATSSVMLVGSSAPVLTNQLEQPLFEERVSLDVALSSLTWQDTGSNTRVEARAVIRGDVASAELLVQNYRFILREAEPGVYVGAFTIPESSDALFRVIISPVLQVQTPDGGQVIHPLAWTAPKIVSETPWQRYVQARSWLSRSIPVYTLVRSVLFVIAAIFGGILLLGFFGNYRKQHPHVMLKTAALIALLLLYTRF